MAKETTSQSDRYEITLPLQLRRDYFEEYLRWHFNCPDGDIVASQRSPLGKMLYSMVHVSYVPVKQKLPANCITMRMPVKNDKRLPKGFYHYPPFVVDQINDLIDFYFDTDFRQYCLVGNEIGVQRKHIYASFLKNRQIKKTGDFYERLKKRDFRRRQSLLKLIDENSNEFGYQSLKK